MIFSSFEILPNMYSKSNSLNCSSPIDDHNHEIENNKPASLISSKEIDKARSIHNSIKKLFISSKPKNRDISNKTMVEDDDFLNSLLVTENPFPNPKRRKINSSGDSLQNPSHSPLNSSELSNYSEIPRQLGKTSNL